MPPENLRFGGGADETVLHPIVLVAMLLAIVLIWLLPRKWVIAPVLAMTFLVPLGQQVLIGGLHLMVYRIIILAASLRILASVFGSPEGAFGKRLDKLDLVFLLWALLRASAVMLLFLQSGAVINQLAFLLDAIGGFFVLRYLICDEEDIDRTLQVFAVICMIIGVCMVYEKVHQVNVFGWLGGVRAEPEVRLGRVRAQGPFEHELLAGTFGATLMPLFFLLWKKGKSRVLATLGIIAATVITVMSASSTPVLAYGAAVFAILCWPLRRQMRVLRWGIVAGLIALNAVMKAPVWFAIQHIDVVGGSSGYHRAMLVNDLIMHFRDWWLIGTKENAAWGTDMWDLCDQYVAEGQTGGLATLICFIAMICMCFSRIGTARKAVAAAGDQAKEWYFWLLGCTMFSHVVGYFGISYFDQTRVSWFALLAIISAATAPYMVKKATEAEQPRFSWAKGGAPGYPAGAPAPAPAVQAGRSRALPLPRQNQFRTRLS